MKLKTLIKQSRMKPLDVVIIFFLILCSFLPLAIFGYQQGHADSATNQTIAVLRVDGKEIKTFDLSDDKKSYTYMYKDKDGDYNLIEVADGKIRVKDTNCGDLICVRRGWISKKGESIVCLPHKLVIDIQSSTGGDDGELIY
ncbi:NusG domain II-containing protein [uncultured Enterococcus sp.]|uniref:NusG domain II-containing protein n=1 Tax=uncultured Enterococcus sp. TaxID=167972 RepID=UPI0025D17543|nr:NusG domain II-containing protein [uncultured Enterococcus sp.]